MLSPIDEEGEVTGKLDICCPKPDPCPKKSLSQMVGGHGPWQLRYWLLYLLAGFGWSLHLFSVFPFSSAMGCPCKSDADSNAATHDILGGDNKTCLSETFLHFKLDSQNCSNVMLVIYAKCIYFIGFLLSALTVQFLSIRFGKRSTSLASALFLLASSFAIAWVQDSVAFLITRFIISYSMTNVYMLSIFSLKEFVGEDYVLAYGITGHLGWNLAHLTLPLVAWLTGDWFNFSLATSCLAFILFIFLCFIPESVDAYLSKGLNARAQKVIRQAAWSNGYPSEDIGFFAGSLEYNEVKSDLKQLNCKLCFQMFIRILIGLSASFLYLASVWQTDWRKVDRGAYYALAGTTEVAATLILLFFTCFLQPKHLWSTTTILASASLLLMYAKSNEESPISTPPFLLTMFFSSAAATLFWMRTFFHPHLNSSRWDTAASIVGFCAGAILASLIDLQKSYDWNPKLFVIFGIPNLTIGCSIAVIPERFFGF